MGKKQKNKNKQAQQNNSSTQTGSKEILSAEDKDLLEKAKKLVTDGDGELKGLYELLAQDMVEKNKEELKKQNENLKEEVSENQKKFDDLKTEISDLEEKKKELKKGTDSAQSFIDNQKRNAEFEADKITKAAKDEAEEILKTARDKVDEIQKERLKEIAAEEDKIKKERKKLNNDKEDFESDREALNEENERVQKMKEIYSTAKPDIVENLKTELSAKEEALETFRKEYEKIQQKLTEADILKAKTDGFTKEQLQQERERALAELENLQNKFMEYDDARLKEMADALEEKPKLHERIDQLNKELALKKLELARKENVQLEYEELKERVSLLRTLNDHLRTELSTAKKMLENSIGDICPALTQIDVKAKSYKEERELIEKREKPLDLKRLAEHVRNYAACNNLYYSLKDIKAFIAGLAASRLTILQGMSGTGKTSLPKIFMKAISGEVNIVPVESSWRDRNELLGYYNDFSKKYTAKEFTCDLYKANTEAFDNVPYFIVLDEMNLSRVEYYFADFLSVLENEPENWKIQLVDVDMRQLPSAITPEVRRAIEDDDSERGKQILRIVEKLYPAGSDSLDSDAVQGIQGDEQQKLLQYLAEKNFKNDNGTRLVNGPEMLHEGKSIFIPKNVWFIGTANKDESTFEITDKVYDRAQVLNFSARADLIRQKKPVSPVFFSRKNLEKLFDEARKSSSFEGEENDIVKSVDNILRENYKISFGNRILDQINKFVPVYIAASDDANDKIVAEALDYQITNKILRKLEYVDMKSEAIDELYKIFENNNMIQAKAFIDLKRKEN